MYPYGNGDVDRYSDQSFIKPVCYGIEQQTTQRACAHRRLQPEGRCRQIDLHDPARQPPALLAGARRAGRGLRLPAVEHPRPTRTGTRGRGAERLLQADDGAAVPADGPQSLARSAVHARRCRDGDGTFS